MQVPDVQAHVADHEARTDPGPTGGVAEKSGIPREQVAALQAAWERAKEQGKKATPE